MPRPCSICSHPRRRDIDAALVSGESVRAIAGRFAIPRSNLARHAPHVQAATRAAEQAHVLDVSQHVQAVAGVGVRLLAGHDPRVQLQAGGLILRVCEFVHAMDQEAATVALTERIERLEQALTESASNGKAHWTTVA